MTTTLKIEVAVVGICVLLIIIFITVCVFGPCPINRLIFKRKYGIVDDEEGERKDGEADDAKHDEEEGAASSGSPQAQTQDYKYKEISETATEHDLILESIMRNVDNSTTFHAEEENYVKLWEDKSVDIPAAPPIKLNSTVELVGRLVTVQVNSASDTPGPLLGLWHNNVINTQVISFDQMSRRNVLNESKTSIVSKTSNPIFNDVLYLVVPKDEELKTLHLCIYCCDYDKYSRVNIVGEILIPLSQLAGPENVLNLQDAPMDAPETDPDRGEILIALNYMATSEKVKLIVLKAKNLPSEENSVVDPYVKIAVTKGHDVINRKRLDPVRGDTDPVFNQTVNLDLNEITAGKVIVIVSVMDSQKRRRYQPEGHQCIGRLCLGSLCYGTGRPHWLEMLAKPRRPIAYWHKLSDLKKGTSIFS